MAAICLSLLSSCHSFTLQSLSLKTSPKVTPVLRFATTTPPISVIADAAKRRDEKIFKRDAVEYEKHRTRGHFPYDPTCVQCQQSR